MWKNFLKFVCIFPIDPGWTLTYFFTAAEGNYIALIFVSQSSLGCQHLNINIVLQLCIFKCLTFIPSNPCFYSGCQLFNLNFLVLNFSEEEVSIIPPWNSYVCDMQNDFQCIRAFLIVTVVSHQLVLLDSGSE
jgi:hypothetical protein